MHKVRNKKLMLEKDFFSFMLVTKQINKICLALKWKTWSNFYGEEHTMIVELYFAMKSP
jgi:hypothetical protein